jgi:hypothetical protein
MTKVTSPDPLKDEPTARLHAILDGDKEDEPTRTSEPPRSILDGLPRASKPASPTPKPRAARVSATKPRLEAGTGRKSRRERYTHAFWNVTSWLSLAVDAVLIAVVIILLIYVRKLNVQMNELMSLSSMPLDTVSGLYTNFEKMNNAHIVTTIPLDTEIPVQFDIQIDQQTEVVLSQDTPIKGARVTLNTGGLNITNAPANIILPAGTRLPILLTLTVPVDKRVPVHLTVPVDINLALTDLGVPFTGLMDVLEPLYCLLDPQAVDSQGVLICEKAKTP